MRYANIIPYDIANGEGIRTTIFLTGCNLHCNGCFNKDIQSFEAGSLLDKAVVDCLVSSGSKKEVDGFSILGGEPFDQDKYELFSLIYSLSLTGKSIWVWSGHTFEELANGWVNIATLALIDVLVDGRFIESQRDLSLKFRGSRNQRIIDVKKSLSSRVAVPYVLKGDKEHGNNQD